MIDREVLITHVATKFVGLLESLACLGREPGLRSADGAGLTRDALVELGGDVNGIEVGRDEQRTRNAVGLVEQGEEEMRGRDVGVAGGSGLGGGGLEGFAGLDGPTLRVECHQRAFLFLVGCGDTAIEFCTGTRSRR